MKHSLIRLKNDRGEKKPRLTWNAEFRKFGKKYGDLPSVLAVKAIEKEFVVPGMKVLEVGGGTGRNSMFFASRGIDVFHLDISDVAIAVLCNELSERKLKEGEITAMRMDFFRTAEIFQEGIFDVIFANFCLHLLSIEQRVSFVSNAERLLRMDGLLILSLLSTSDGDYSRAVEGKFGREKDRNTWRVNGYSQHFFEEDEIYGMFSQTTFRFVEFAQMNEMERIITDDRKTSFWMVVAKKVVG